MLRTVSSLRGLWAMAAMSVLAVVALPRPASALVKFETSPQKAMARAAAENKPIMLDVYTDWCGWCKKLDKDVYARMDVSSALAKGFVALKVNPEADAASKKFVDRYKVQGFPTILFLDAKGKELHRIGGYEEAPEFIRDLKTAQTKHKASTTPKARKS